MTKKRTRSLSGSALSVLSEDAYWLTKPKSLLVIVVSAASEGTAIVSPVPMGHAAPFAGPVWLQPGSICTHTVYVPELKPLNEYAPFTSVDAV